MGKCKRDETGTTWLNWCAVHSTSSRTRDEASAVIKCFKNLELLLHQAYAAQDLWRQKYETSAKAYTDLLINSMALDREHRSK
jgi:hypothetical protein